MSIIYRFDGNRHREAQYYSGVPARSLTQEDYDALDADARALVREGTLYTPVEPKSEPAAEPDKPAPDAPTRKRGTD